MGQLVPATKKAKLLHDVQGPAKIVDLVPAMKQDTLISIGKFVDAGNVKIFNGDKENVNDGLKAKLKVSEEAIIQG